MEQISTVFSEENPVNSGIFADSEVYWAYSIPEQRLLFVTPNIEHLTGYKQSDFYLNPKLWLNLIQNYDKPKPSRRIVNDNLVFESSYSIRNKNNENFDVREILIPVLNEKEELIQINVYTKINRSEMQSPRVINEIAIPFFEAEFSNSELKFFKVSQRFYDELLQVKDEIDKSETFQKFLKILSEKVIEFNFTNNLKFEFELDTDESEKIFLFELTLKEKSDKKIIFTGAGIDITELKINERHLQKLNNDKNRLLTIVSHDLKAPFNTILNFINLLNDGIEIDEEQKKEYLKYIYDSAKQQIELIHDLLDWSKVESGLLEFTPNFLDLYSIVNKIISGFSGQIHQKQLKIDLKIDRRTKVFFDKNYLKIVLSNILSNAIKFSHKNGKIIISANEERDYSIIQIQDFGIGFSERYLKQLKASNNFEIQIGTMGEKGTGFGLKFCYDIIQSNHGKLNIETQSQKETKVIIKLRNPAARIVYFDEDRNLLEIKNKVSKFQPEVYVYLCNNVFDFLNIIKENSPEFVVINYDMIKSFQRSFVEKIFSDLTEITRLFLISSQENNIDEILKNLNNYKFININKSKIFILSFLRNLVQQMRSGKELKDSNFEHLSI
ncbi:MAG: sensor histidine kinase [Ignavibacteria bacterium]